MALALDGHESHATAIQWFAAQTDRQSVLFCRATQLSMLRLLTTERIVAPYRVPPFCNTGAWKFMDECMADPRVAWAPEPPGLAPRWKALARRRTPSPKLWMDSYLAAFALAGGHRLVTADHAFTRFAGLSLLVLS